MITSEQGFTIITCCAHQKHHVLDILPISRSYLFYTPSATARGRQLLGCGAENMIVVKLVD